MGAKPEVMITSPFVRAAQTAEIFAEALGFAVEKIRVNDSLKPAGNPAEIIKEITHLRAKEVACFGHAPHLDLTMAQLAGARSAFHGAEESGRGVLRAGSGAWPVGVALDFDSESAAGSGRVADNRLRSPTLPSTERATMACAPLKSRAPGKPGRFRTAGLRQKFLESSFAFAFYFLDPWRPCSRIEFGGIAANLLAQHIEIVDLAQ